MTNSSKYWQTRLSDNIYKENVKLMEKRLLKVYKSASKSIEIQTIDLYSKMLTAGEISANMMYSENRYKVLQDKINQEIIKIGKAEEKEVAKTLLNTFKQVFTETNKGLGVATEWTILNDNMAKEIVFANFKGAKFSDRIWSNKDALRSKLEKAVIETVVGGRSKDVAVKNIKERFGVGFSDADRIVRTETQRVLNEGQKESYMTNGYTQYQYSAELDERTSEICEELDGKIFSFAEASVGVNFPPMHPNCRSTILPVLDEELFK